MGFGSFFKKIGKAVGKVAASPIGGIALGFIPGGGIVSTLARTGLGALAERSARGGGAVTLPGVSRSLAPAGGPFYGGIGGGASFPGEAGFEAALRASRKQLTNGGGTSMVGGGPYGVRMTGMGRRRRRMNAGNAKAARRAIRRIKSVRHLLQTIEKQLPRRRCSHNPGRRIGFRRR
jgi:hypothetical protein